MKSQVPEVSTPQENNESPPASDKGDNDDNLWQHGCYDIEDEARRLMNEMEITIKEVRESEFYREAAHQLREKSEIQDHIKRVLGSDPGYSHVQMVVYCLGSLEFNFRSQYQLALAFLLKEDFSDWIGGDAGIEAFDPWLSPADCVVLEELGFKVLEHNECFRRPVARPTLFFMPSYCKDGMEDLLQENWQPGNLNKTILLANSLKPCDLECEDDDEVEYEPYRQVYAEAICDRAAEFPLPIACRRFCDIFQDFSWQFFDLHPLLNLDDLFPAEPSKEDGLQQAEEDEEEDETECILSERARKAEEIFMRPFETSVEGRTITDWSDSYFEYRGPRWVRCQSLPPQPGWHKLNITGIELQTKKQACFGGVLTDDKGELLARYCGNLGSNKDKLVAVAVALRMGAGLVSRQFPEVTNLIVEGNDVSFVRWVNDGPEPPKRIEEYLFCARFHMLKEIETVVYHVYDEANTQAMEMAKKGGEVAELRACIYKIKSGGEEEKKMIRIRCDVTC